MRWIVEVQPGGELDSLWFQSVMFPGWYSEEDVAELVKEVDAHRKANHCAYPWRMRLVGT